MDDRGEDATGPFVRMLAHLRDPLLIVSRSGTIVGASVAAAEALGTTTQAFAGTSMSAYADEPGSFDARIIEASRDGGTVPLRTVDGRRFSCHPTVLDRELVLVRLTGGPDPATRARGFFEMMPRLDRVISSGAPDTLEELSLTMLPFAMTSVGASRGGLWLLDQDGPTLELVGSIGYNEGIVDHFRLVPMALSLPITDCVRGAKPIYFLAREDYEPLYPGFLDRFAAVDAAAVLLPLVVEGRCIGGIALGREWPWHLSEPDRDFLETFAAQCALTFDRTRRAGRERARSDPGHSAARFEGLHAFTGALARAITPADVAEVVVDAGMAATAARSGGLWLCDDDGRTITLVRSVGPTGPRPEHFVRVPIDRSARMPILDAVQNGVPVWLESCRQLEARYPDAFKAFSRGGESSLVCLPLHAQGRCVGGLALNYDHAHRFSENERAYFELIAWYAAQAIERARLYAAEQRARTAAEARQRRSEFLADLDPVLASLDPQSILTIASAAVPRIANSCVIILEDEIRRGIPPTVAPAGDPMLPLLLAIHTRTGTHGPAEVGLRAVIRTGRPQHFRRITPELIRATITDPELAELCVQTGVVSTMITPITVRDRTLGGILLCSTDPSRTYDEDDLAMAVDLGRRLGLALDNARLYLESREDDRLKDEFLAMLSHELRNPLVPIVAAVDLMELENSEQFAAERGLIQRNAMHLVRLVDDLIDVSRITRGSISLVLEQCDLGDLVREATDIAFPLLEQRGHRLLVGSPRRPIPVFADRIRIAQAIANLLTNAAKYTEPGGTITVTVEADASSAVVTVEDTGIGISDALLPRVFDIFVQGPDIYRGGLGIGLTIVKRLVELNGGTVTAFSAGLGQGSKFAVRLPLSTITTSPVPIIATPRATVVPAPNGRRVLVVDDNHDAAEVIARMMSKCGYVPHVAHDGHAALELAAEMELDLALIDLGMPGMDGYELGRRLRESYPALRMAAVTGFGRPSDRARAREAGFDDHIVKPVTLEILRRVAALHA